MPETCSRSRKYAPGGQGACGAVVRPGGPGRRPPRGAAEVMPQRAGRDPVVADLEDPRRQAAEARSQACRQKLQLVLDPSSALARPAKRRLVQGSRTTTSGRLVVGAERRQVLEDVVVAALGDRQPASCPHATAVSAGPARTS